MDQRQEPCPYVGLQPFTETHQKYFYGRSRDARIIAANLCASALTVLYGPSGVGKSSILQARVIPRLRTSSPSPIILFRDWQGRFLDNLKRDCIRAVESRLHRTLDIDQSVPFDELLLIVSRASGNSILFVLDQFEEYFLYHPESESDNLFDIELARAINREDIDANFLIALREDTLSKLDRFQLRIPNLLGNSLRLNHLDASGAEEAIRKPLEIYKRDANPARGPIEIEDALVIEILAQVRPERIHLSENTGAGRAQEIVETGEIATPFLQLVAMRLWEEEAERGSSKVRLKTLQDLGQVNGIVKTHLDDTMQTLSFNEKEVAARIFHYLVTPSGTKIAQTVEDLAGYIQLNKQSIETIVEKLSKGDKRILTSVPLPDQSDRRCYQIFHDVLAPAVLAWRARFVKEQEIVEAKKIAALEETKKRKKLLKVGLSVLFFTIATAIFSILWSNMKTTEAELETERTRTLLNEERKKQEEFERNRKRAVTKTEADSLYNKGYKATLTNAISEAMKDFTDALVLYQELEDRPNQVRVLTEIGKLYAFKNQYADAKSRYDEALQITQASHDLQAQGRVLERFAALYLKQENREKAIEFYNRARKIYEEAQDPQSEANVLEQLGIDKEGEGKIDEARTRYNEALVKYRFADDQAGIRRVLNALNAVTTWGFLLDLATAEVYPLKGNEIKIGRNVENQDVLNDISFSDSLISRRHLAIRRDLSLEDLRSRNGTSVNGGMLPYGFAKKLTDKDIITLANIKSLQFLTSRPAKDPRPPEKAWGIFIDNQSKIYQYLTKSQYSLVFTNRNISIKEGFHDSAVMKLRRDDTTGRPQMFEVADDWHIEFTIKVTDYDYKKYTLRDGIWTEAIDLPLKYMKLTADLKFIVEEGPSFQIVGLGEQSSHN